MALEQGQISGIVPLGDALTFSASVSLLVPGGGPGHKDPVRSGVCGWTS